METNQNRSRSGPLHRVTASDFSTAGDFFKAAMLLITPDDQTQRKAFESLMPEMYVLRNRGCSFAQITKLLNESGFKLQPSSVRTYYNEMLVSRQDICQARMNEQILLLAEVRKQTKGQDVGSIAARVEAIMSKQRAQVDGKLDAVFGAVTPPSAAVRVEAAQPPRGENKKAGLRPAPVPAPASLDSAGDFGLLSGDEAVVQQASVVPAFFGGGGGGDAVAVSRNFQNEAASPPAVPDNWRCQALIAGVPALDRRANVPDDVYVEGDLEHPAVPGLLLSLDQRLSSVALEFVNLDSGEIRLETPFEKRFRVSWKKPIPMTITSTSGDFTTMDPSLMK